MELMDKFKHNRNCTRCGKTHFCAEDDFLPDICASCYIELFKKIPSYIPNEQQGMWLERMVDKHVKES